MACNSFRLSFGPARVVLRALLFVLLAAAPAAAQERHIRVPAGGDLAAAYARVASPGLVELEAGDYQLSAPLLWSKDRITVRGQGRDVTRILAPWCGLAVVTLRDPPLRGDERIPLKGVLDDSAADRFGYRLSPGRTLVGLHGGGAAIRQAGYLKRDGWAGADGLTLQFAARFRQPVKDTTRAFGLDAFEDDPSPWLVHFDFHVGTYGYYFRGADGRLFRLTFACGDYRAGVQRVALQFALASRSARAWVNDRPAAVAFEELTGLWPLQSWTAAAPERWPAAFATNEVAEWRVWGHADWDLLALRWDYGPVYADEDAPRRLDGEPLTDFTRYYRDPDGTIGCHPHGAAETGRVIACKAGYGADHWLILEADHYSPWFAVAGLRLEALEIAGSNECNQVVSVGNLLHGTVRDCRIHGGTVGLGPIRTAVSYPLTLEDLELDGKWCSVHLYAATFWGRNWRLGYGGYCFGYFEGSGPSLENVFANSPGAGMKHYFVLRNSDDATRFTFTRAGIDDEGGGPALSACVRLDAWRGGKWAVTWRDGALPPVAAAGFALKQSGGGSACELRLDGFDYLGTGAPVAGAGGRWVLTAAGE